MNPRRQYSSEGSFKAGHPNQSSAFNLLGDETSLATRGDAGQVGQAGQAWTNGLKHNNTYPNVVEEEALRLT